MTKKKVTKEIKPVTTIKNCSFVGVKWDGKALEAVETIADALLVNAEALKKMAELFTIQNVEPLININ